jgi:hypothetical protein
MNHPPTGNINMIHKPITLEQISRHKSSLEKNIPNTVT